MSDAGREPRMGAVVALEPDPGAPSTARKWVAAALDGWPPQSIETARLLVSELVTNAVLHARTEIDLRHRLEGRRARIEVADRRRDGPTPKRYSPDSPTGRGMRLVEALATEWGVTRSADGKVVWFVVTPDSGSGDGLSTMFDDIGTPHRKASEVLSASGIPRGGAGSARDGTGEPSGTPPVPDRTVHASPGMARVEILSLPLEVYLEAEQHHDAIIRELTLLLQSSESSEGLEVPARLVEIAAGVRRVFAAVTTSTRVEVERAIRQRRDTMDITVEVPIEGWQALQRLVSQLEEADRFCEAGDLLTLASPSRLRRFRRWYARQVADQAQGLPATPWPQDTAALPM